MSLQNPRGESRQVSSGAEPPAPGEFARDLVTKMISDKLQGAVNQGALVQETLRRHGAYLDAIRDRDGALAEALAREDLCDYYGPFVNDAEPDRLSRLLTCCHSSTLTDPS